MFKDIQWIKPKRDDQSLNVMTADLCKEMCLLCWVAADPAERKFYCPKE